MKSAGKARNNGLYRHIRTSKEIIRNLLNDYIKYTTTADILVDAYERGFITESQGNTIWSNMLSKRRRIGGASFSDYLKSKSS